MSNATSQQSNCPSLQVFVASKEAWASPPPPDQFCFCLIPLAPLLLLPLPPAVDGAAVDADRRRGGAGDGGQVLHVTVHCVVRLLGQLLKNLAVFFLRKRTGNFTLAALTTKDEVNGCCAVASIFLLFASKFKHCSQKLSRKTFEKNVARSTIESVQLKSEALQNQTSLLSINNKSLSLFFCYLSRMWRVIVSLTLPLSVLPQVIDSIDA